MSSKSNMTALTLTLVGVLLNVGVRAGTSISNFSYKCFLVAEFKTLAACADYTVNALVEVELL